MYVKKCCNFFNNEAFCVSIINAQLTLSLLNVFTITLLCIHLNFNILFSYVLLEIKIKLIKCSYSLECDKEYYPVAILKSINLII